MKLLSRLLAPAVGVAVEGPRVLAHYRPDARALLAVSDLRGAWLGAVPGALAAAIWTAFDTDCLTPYRASGGQHG